jgi:hypothetical protein
VERQRPERSRGKGRILFVGDRFRLGRRDEGRVALGSLLGVQVQVGSVIPQETPSHDRVGKSFKVLSFQGLQIAKADAGFRFSLLQANVRFFSTLT